MDPDPTDVVLVQLGNHVSLVTALSRKILLEFESRALCLSLHGHTHTHAHTHIVVPFAFCGLGLHHLNCWRFCSVSCLNPDADKAQ